MKKIVPLFVGMLAGGVLQAQETTINKKHLQERAQQYLQKMIDNEAGKMPNLAHVPGGNRVVTLLQDGMPCIVPDTRGLAPMPNAMAPKSEPGAGRIPNAWKGKRQVMPVK